MNAGKTSMLTVLTAMLLLGLVTGSAAALRSIEWSTNVITSLARALTLEDGSNIICGVGTTLTLNSRSVAKIPGTIGRVLFKVLGEETGAERCSSGRWSIKREIQQLRRKTTVREVTSLSFRRKKSSVFYQKICLHSND